MYSENCANFAKPHYAYAKELALHGSFQFQHWIIKELIVRV